MRDSIDRDIDGRRIAGVVRDDNRVIAGRRIDLRPGAEGRYDLTAEKLPDFENLGA